MGKPKEKEIKYKVFVYVEEYISTLPHKKDRERYDRFHGVLYNFIVKEKPNPDEIECFAKLLFRRGETYPEIIKRLQ